MRAHKKYPDDSLEFLRELSTSDMYHPWMQEHFSKAAAEIGQYRSTCAEAMNLIHTDPTEARRILFRAARGLLTKDKAPATDCVDGWHDDPVGDVCPTCGDYGKRWNL